MNVIDVKVDKKIASLVDCNAYIVCDNEDYRLRFYLDEEWQSCGEKTAIFTSVGNGKKLTWERVFTGDAVDVPSFKDCEFLDIGLACGSLRTTTSAHIRCLPSARTGTTDVTQSVDYALGYEAGAYEVNRGVVELVGGTQTTGVGAVTEVNATFAEELIAKGVEVFAGETTIELVGKLPLIEQPVLERLGTEQESAFSAVQEINATLAKTLTGKGVEAEATETTEGLARKVGQIEDWVLTYATSISFANVGLYDEGALKHFPNMHLANIKSCVNMFSNNQQVQTVGDIYAPKLTDAGFLFRGSYVRQVGRLVFPEATTLGNAFASCPYIERIEEIVAPKCTSYYQFAYSNSTLKYIGGEIDLTHCTDSNSTFRAFGGDSMEHVCFVAGSIHVQMDFQKSSKLDDESRQSIKNGLANLTGQTQQTIYFHAAVLAKYTEDELAEMVSKNWIVK